MKGLVPAYRALTEIYRGTWIGEAIKRQGAALTDHKGAYRLVYGVVEHEYLYAYRISRLTVKPPKASAAILLKMGMYLSDCTEIPDYAAVSEIAETAKQIGKGGLTGFLNATLRRYVTEGKTLFPTDPVELLSVRANLPVWLIKRYQTELGEEAAARRLTVPRTVRTHVRPAVAVGKEALASLLKERLMACEETPHGFYIGAVGAVSDLLREGKATVMSFGSAEVASAVPFEGGAILDLCAAPGGKSVYLAEKYEARVIACDLYPHRVDLIRKYAERMHVASVEASVWDGTVPKAEWEGAFGTVLLDVPCSGLGSLASDPDIALNRTEEGLAEIVATQSRLIRTAARYVASGGALVYATCSDLPSEDGDVVRAFLAEENAFSLEKEKYTDPEQGGGESYYYAVLRKK